MVRFERRIFVSRKNMTVPDSQIESNHFSLRTKHLGVMFWCLTCFSTWKMHNTSFRNIKENEPATSRDWRPKDPRISQGLSALPVGTPWCPILPESYSLYQHRENTAQSSVPRKMWKITFTCRRTSDAMCGGTALLMCKYLLSQHLARPSEKFLARCLRASPSPWWPSEKTGSREVSFHHLRTALQLISSSTVAK
jgi:hypothetical protein